MTAPLFYLVADGNAFAIEDDGYMFGAAVNDDGSVDWSGSYEFSPDEEDVEYVAHMCNLLKQAQQGRLITVTVTLTYSNTCAILCELSINLMFSEQLISLATDRALGHPTQTECDLFEECFWLYCWRRRRRWWWCWS